MAKLLGGLLALGLMLVAGGTWLVLYSSLPVKVVEKGLRAGGFEVEGMTGSLNRGFEVASLAKKSANGDFRMEKVRLAYGGLWQVFSQKRLIIEDISADRFELKGLKLTSSSENNSPTEKSAPAAVNGTRFPLKEIAIRNLRIKNVLIETSVTGPLTMSDMTLTNLDLKPLEKLYVLDELKVVSSLYDLQVRKLMLDNGKFKTGEKVLGTIKPGLYKDLKKDLNFSVTAEGSTDAFSADISLMDNGIAAKVNPDKSFNITINDLTPADFVVTDLPIVHINAKVDAKDLVSAALGMVPFSGTLQLGDALFQTADKYAAAPPPPPVAVPARSSRKGAQKAPAPLPPPKAEPMTAYYDRDGVRFSLKFKPQLTFGMGGAAAGNAASSWFQLSSTAHQSTKEALASLIYKKTYNKLSPPERQVLDKAAPTLGELAIAQAPSTVTAPLTLSPMPNAHPDSSDARMPTSVTPTSSPLAHYDLKPGEHRQYTLDNVSSVTRLGFSSKPGFEEYKRRMAQKEYIVFRCGQGELKSPQGGGMSCQPEGGKIQIELRNDTRVPVSVDLYRK